VIVPAHSVHDSPVVGSGGLLAGSVDDGVDAVGRIPGESGDTMWILHQRRWESEGRSVTVANPANIGQLFGGDRGKIGLSGDLSTIVVATDRARRGQAAGLGAAAVPSLEAVELLERGRLRCVRMSGDRVGLERFAHRHGAVPLRMRPSPSAGEWELIALVAEDALADASAQRFTMIPLGYDPSTEDLLVLRPEGGAAESIAGLARHRIVAVDGDEVLIALGPDDDLDAIHVHGAHGHTELLLPDTGLLRPARSSADLDDGDDGDLSAHFEDEADRLGSAAAGFDDLGSPVLERVQIDEAAKAILRAKKFTCTLMTSSYRGNLDRYTGLAPLDAAGPIVSRHVSHPDNIRAVNQLMADLTALGYCPRRHDFAHGGRTLHNVFADLPGAGIVRIQRPILDAYTRAVRPIPDLPPGPPIDAELRVEVERILDRQRWHPWSPKCGVAGLGAGLVIVGAHMDSTAASSPGYSPATGAAPGRDDNASGLAAVLTLARWFRGLAGKLTHTVRFCFFNAEEAGLIGSKAYASLLKSLNAPIRAVYCLDMIGYNSDAVRSFELHAGYVDPAVRDLSLPLAAAVASAAASYGTLLPAQVYQGTSWNGSPDRSDHAAFQQQGWGAVLASEDFFVNLASESGADPNPNYHKTGDANVDVSYARAITCAVGRAAMKSAL
jgi:hypothetical protein